MGLDVYASGSQDTEVAVDEDDIKVERYADGTDTYIYHTIYTRILKTALDHLSISDRRIAHRLRQLNQAAFQIWTKKYGTLFALPTQQCQFGHV